MNPLQINYNSDFELQFKKLPKIIQKKALKAEILFRQNPFHPSLRLHKLKGKLSEIWSISIDKKHRILFIQPEANTFLFFSIGTHAIYQ